MEGKTKVRELLGELRLLRNSVRKKQQELTELIRESAAREWMSPEDYLQQVLQSVLNTERGETALDESHRVE